MKKLTCMIMSLTMMLTLSAAVFAAEAVDSPKAPTGLVQSTRAPEQTPGSQPSARKLYHTGVIAGGGSNYSVIFQSNPWINQTWTIGRSSGTAGKIDIEVRNEQGQVLASKAFHNDGDTPLSVFIPWDAGTCSVRVYNNNSYDGSWAISIFT